MINFKTFIESVWSSSGYRNNPIPMGKYNEDNVQSPMYHIEKQLGGNTPTTHINVPEMVKNGTLKATQSYLYRHGGGDPVFDELEHPVLFKDEQGIHHIIDGHHRLANALERHANSTEVHIFSK